MFFIWWFRRVHTHTTWPDTPPPNPHALGAAAGQQVGGKGRKASPIELKQNGAKLAVDLSVTISNSFRTFSDRRSTYLVPTARKRPCLC